MDSRAVVTSFFACWCVQDLEMALVHMHPDVVYTIHNGVDASPFSGIYRGPDRIRDLGFAILTEFDYLTYEPSIVAVHGDFVRARVTFRYRHRPTGYVMEGSRRLEFVVKDGLIARLDSYEDARRLEAFMRMIRQKKPAPIEPNLSAVLSSSQKSGAGASALHHERTCNPSRSCAGLSELSRGRATAPVRGRNECGARRPVLPPAFSICLDRSVPAHARASRAEAAGRRRCSGSGARGATSDASGRAPSLLRAVTRYGEPKGTGISRRSRRRRAWSPSQRRAWSTG